MLVKALRVGTVQIYTAGLSKADLKDVCVGTVPSIEEAVLSSVRVHRDPEIAVVPEGPYVIPMFDRD